MSSKDYYAILQVHPEAERIVIDAAYRRLAREYHPDVNNEPGAHERMVLINRAYEVLSDPDARREYDSSLRGSAGRPAPSASASYASSQTSSASAQADQRDEAQHRADTQSYSRGIPRAPDAPDPGEFGIGNDYYERAVEGARAWKGRKRAVPPNVAIGLRGLAWVIGLCLTGLGFVGPGKDWLPVTFYAWLAIPAATESALAAMESANDKKLRTTTFDPQYNPNPHGWSAYADAYTKWESQLADVFVPRSGYRFHSRSWCSSMVAPSSIPKYHAEALGYTPCSRCGYFAVRVKQLPAPFGNGALPETTPTKS